MPQCADLTPDQIDRLDAIHFIWEDAYTRRWQYGYEQARAYYEANGHLNPPVSYTSPQGFNLYKWLVRQRKIEQPEERRAALEAIGYDFNPPDSFETHLALCQEYFKEHGDLNPPADYKADSVWLARWLNEQRRIYRGKVRNKHLTAEQVKKLEAAGMDWRTASERAWENQYQAVEHYVRTTGQADIPKDIPTREGRRMRLWLDRQKKACQPGQAQPGAAGKAGGHHPLMPQDAVMAIVAIQTTTRKESNLIRYMDQLAEPGLITEVFLPKREVLKRYKGAWNKQEEILFPGYLFVETPDVTAFFYALKDHPHVRQTAGGSGSDYNALTPEEETFIRRIGGRPRRPHLRRQPGDDGIRRAL